MEVDGHVAAFGRGAGTPVIKMSLVDKGSPDAGADRDVENVFVSGASAPQRLGQPGGVRVVVELGRQSADGLHSCKQCEIAPAREVGTVQHQPALGI